MLAINATLEDVLAAFALVLAENDAYHELHGSLQHQIGRRDFNQFDLDQATREMKPTAEWIDRQLVIRVDG